MTFMHFKSKLTFMGLFLLLLLFYAQLFAGTMDIFVCSGPKQTFQGFGAAMYPMNGNYGVTPHDSLLAMAKMLFDSTGYGCNFNYCRLWCSSDLGVTTGNQTVAEYKSLVADIKSVRPGVKFL